MKTERVTLLTTPDFKAFLTKEAKREGVSVGQLVRDRCERRATDEETTLVAMTRELNVAVAQAQASLKIGLDEAQATIASLSGKRLSLKAAGKQPRVTSSNNALKRAGARA